MNRYDDRYYPMSTRGYYDNRPAYPTAGAGVDPYAMRGYPAAPAPAAGAYPGYRGNGYDNLDPQYDYYMMLAKGGGGGGAGGYGNRGRADWDLRIGWLTLTTRFFPQVVTTEHPVLTAVATMIAIASDMVMITRTSDRGMKRTGIMSTSSA